MDQHVLAIRSARSSAESASIASPSSSLRRDFLFAQCRDVSAGDLEVRRYRPIERLEESIDHLQQTVERRLPGPLPERRADVVGNGAAAVLQVHDRTLARSPAPTCFDGVRTGFADSVFHRGRVVRRARAVLEEQVERLRGVHGAKPNPYAKYMILGNL